VAISSRDDFLFVNSLEITQSGLPFDEDDKEVLEKSLSEIKNDIESIKESILELKEKLQQKEQDQEHLSTRLQNLTNPVLEIVTGEPTITKAADTIDKATFLLNLFNGMKDVYAVRRWNNETGKAAYSPRCMNFWTGQCLKKKHKDKGNRGERPDCSKCEARFYEELTPELVVVRQLKNPDIHGQNAIGIYPMLPGNVCCFMAIDLDEETWQQDSLSLANAARVSGFQMAIERSFSGNGAHLWLFFSEPVPAYKARKLAFSFIDKACQCSKTLSLKSYDRVFPSQDIVEEGGLGNLILMPLFFGAAKRKENPGTVFVDNSFHLYSDQIAFLSSLPRYTENDIDKYLMTLESISFFSTSDYLSDGVDIMWQSRLPKLGKSDCFNKTLPIFLSCGLSIPKKAMSAKMQDAFKRLACFPNPEYYKALHRNQGYASENMNSFVLAYIESDTVLQLPRGLKELLLIYRKQNRINYDLKDMRTQETDLNAEFSGTLRDEQNKALRAIQNSECGILRAATSFGKTVVAAALIAERKEKTLILVHKQDLLDQWKDKLHSFLTIYNKPVKREGKRANTTGIGLLGNSRDSISGYVDIATFQTVASRMPEFIKNYGMVIVDECHHVAADSLMKVMNAVCPKYVFGLSATVRRDDGLESLVFAQCGKVAFEYNADKLAYNRGIVQNFIPRFTSSTLPVLNGRHFNHMDAIKTLSADETRNSLIASDACDLVNAGHKVLILTGLVEHVKLLGRKLLSEGKKAVLLTGQMPRTEIKTSHAILEEGWFDVIVSTGQFLGEGTDIPSLDCLLIATPVSWEGVVSQYAGRIAREYEGKQRTFIYDYVDVCIPQFARMYLKRMKTYRKLGYVAKDARDLSENCTQKEQLRGLFPDKSFYAQDDILDPLINSIRCAKSRVILSSPQIYLSKPTKTIIDELNEAQKRGVSVMIRTSSIDSAFNPDAQNEGMKYLSQIGLSVSTSPNSFLRFLVIDSSEIWFGDMNLLGGAINSRNQTNADQKVMLHTFSKMAADSLLESDFLI